MAGLLRINSEPSSLVFQDCGPFHELFSIFRGHGSDDQTPRVRGGRFPMRPVIADKDCSDFSPGKV
jgi:hypothetical protein